MALDVALAALLVNAVALLVTVVFNGRQMSIANEELAHTRASVDLLQAESKAARFAQKVDLHLNLEEKFWAPAMKRDRIKAAHGLLEGRPRDTREVLHFFEMTGMLLRQDALDREMLWQTFTRWATHYWLAAQGYIQAQQAEDASAYTEFRYLVEELARISLREKAGAVTSGSPQTVPGFLEEEAHLLVD